MTNGSRPLPYADDIETIPEDEADDIQRVIKALELILARSHAKSGQFRADVHVKTHGYAQAELRVLPNLPDELAQGLFEHDGVYRAVARFSNAASQAQPDVIPDGRGLTTNNRGFYGVFGGTGPQTVSSATESAYWQNTYDPEAEWGPMFHDVRHNFIFSATYELPWGKGRKYGSEWSGVTNAFLGGWKLGGIFQARTGLPVTVLDGRNRSLQNERAGDRPNCIGDWKPSNQSVTADSSSTAESRWLNINGFQAVPLGTFGNCPVGVARAPGYSNVDLVPEPMIHLFWL